MARLVNFAAFIGVAGLFFSFSVPTSARPTPDNCYDDIVRDLGVTVCFARSPEQTFIQSVDEKLSTHSHENHTGDYEAVIGGQKNRHAKPGKLGSIVAKYPRGVGKGLALFDFYVFEGGRVKESTEIQVSEDGHSWKYGGCIGGGSAWIKRIEAVIPKDKEWPYIRISSSKRPECKSESDPPKWPGPDISAVGLDVISVAFYPAPTTKSRHSNDEEPQEANRRKAFFDFDESAMTPEIQSRLASIKELIGQLDDAQIVIAGFTDSDGSGVYNQKLSLERAQSIAYYLHPSKSNSKIVWRIEGCGVSPDSGTTVIEKAWDRSVDITILAKSQPPPTKDWICNP